MNPKTDDLYTKYKSFGQAISRGYYDIPFFAETFLGMPLHPGQRRYLENANKKINVIVPGNRWGKSVAVAIKHIHHNFYKVGIGRGNQEAWSRAAYSTVNLAPHTEMTQPVFKAILDILKSNFTIRDRDQPPRNNKCLLGWVLDESHVRNSPPYYIPFAHRSEILFRSTGEDKGDSIQGKNFGYVSYDEGGRSDHLEYEINSNILPRLGDLNGTLDIVSTPDQKSPSILTHMRLFERGQNHDPGYYSQEGDASENIYLPENYVPDMQALYAGDPILDQVLYGKFVFSGDALFPAPDIKDAVDGDWEPKGYEEGHTYVVGVDTAMGEDEQVYTVLDTTNPDKLRVERIIGCKGGSKPPQIHMADFEGLVMTYKRTNNLKILLETWDGTAARFYMDMPYALQVVTKCYGSWQPEGVKLPGRNTKNVKKAEILLALRKVLSKQALIIPNDSFLIEQLSVYREDDSNLPTDRVISLALACWMATDGKPKVSKVVFTEVSW